MNKSSAYVHDSSRPPTADHIIGVIGAIRWQVLHLVPYTLELLAMIRVFEERVL